MAAHSQVKLDANWFQKALEFFVEPYTFLNIDSQILEQEKKAFLDNEKRNPDFSGKYRIDMSVIESRIEKLNDLYDKVISFNPQSNKEKVLKEIYESFLREQRSKFLMLGFTVLGNDTEFARYANKAYGQLDPEICAFTVRTTEIDQVNTELKSIFEKARYHLRSQNVDIPLITEITDTISASPNELSSLPAQEIKEYFEEYLQRIGLENSWSVQIDQESVKRNLSTSQEEKVVWIPSDQVLQSRTSPITKEKVRALAMHEIGVHALRRENGEAKPIALLGLGLPGYLTSEEGLTTVWEQKILGANSYYRSWARYLALAYAQGELTGEVHDFRDTFDFLCSLLYMDEPNDWEQIRQIAWKHCWRIFRGTTGQTPGVVFPKDKVYREGNINIWKAIHRGYIDLEDPRLYQAKFNVLNSQQWEWLNILTN